ncbi:glycosyltransferase [Parapedobacter deserti]|uniref:Glycosyltransferase n=1 Tax=Parapedobacter deserti TaxID=1912957 RepID=A0ABV7JN33_9SPHI
MGSEQIKAIVATPVKDSVENTLETIAAVRANKVAIDHYVYNDFSSAETKQALEQHKVRYGYRLVHLEDLTSHPSPNYRLVLRDAQRQALKKNVPLILVESDVVIEADTIKKMLDFYGQHRSVGLVGAITVDEEGNVNFPYLRFKDEPVEAGRLGRSYVEVRKSLSFCCTLISLEFLREYDFVYLNESKDWFDIFISNQALAMGFKNYLLCDVPVVHRPHGSRPWKQMKYKNPVKYYLLKFLKRRDKI